LKEYIWKGLKNILIRNVIYLVLRGVFGHKTVEVRRMNKNVY
jgi:hypothetical protein